MIDTKQIKKVEAFCMICGITGRIEISKTIEMNDEMLEWMKSKLLFWARNHCEKKFKKKK